MAQQINEQEQMLINQQYKQWKKQAPYKYDLAILRSLQWPSITFQWLPDTSQQQNGNYINHYAIISSNSTQAEQCELQKIKVSIPKANKSNIQNNIDSAYLQDRQAKISIVNKTVLHSEVNRSRHCQLNPDIVASTLANSQVVITYKGQILTKLVSHTNQGYGLNWNPKNAGILATGNTDKRICIWDIQKSQSQSQNKNQQHPTMNTPLTELCYHSAPVQDVAWHKMHPNILGSCSDDRLIMLWDIRSSNNSNRKPLFQIIGHTNQIYSLDFSPFNQFLFISGGGDQSSAVWDMRNLSRCVSRYHSNDAVVKVQWNPFSVNLFATSSYDRKVTIWDLTKKQQQIPLFQHQGHRSKVVDFNWNPNQKLMIGSTQQSNCIHIWEMKKELYYYQQ